MRSSRTLQIRTTPHIRQGQGVDVIMKNLLLALPPVTWFGVFAFGLAGTATLSAAVLACVGTEHLLCKIAGKPSTIEDGSALITGLLLGLTLPPTLAMWMTVIGGVISIAVGKAFFGGLGDNPFSPALVRRAILQASFPVAMTTWHPDLTPGRLLTTALLRIHRPFRSTGVRRRQRRDPAAWKFQHVEVDHLDLALGLVGSTVGSSPILVLLGGLYLVARGMMNWRIPISIMATTLLVGGLLHGLSPETCPSPVFMLLSGGMMLGAWFMASDMVGSPMTHLGIVIYGALIALLTLAIRIWGGMPEGVMYAILLGNAATPLIDLAIQPRVYGRARS